MPKAILELEMPESCSQCPCAQYYDTYGECGAIEYDIDSDFRAVLPSEGRRPDCPLKLVDEHCRNAEWVNGKCRGHRISPYTYEVLVQCKNCKDFEEYKEGE